MEEGGHGYVYRYHGDKNGNGIPDIEEWDKHELEGNGGFNTPEGIELIKEADIIVTNPPFSLFREFVATLEDYGKKYLIIGNMNAITYKEIFPLIKENKMWIGRTGFVSDMVFGVPDGTDVAIAYKQKAEKMGYIGDYTRLGNSCWFTNLDHAKRHEPLDLYKHYTPEEYPKYDNYDAINVNKTCDIPMDYDGVMGVPITFLDKYCPDQFEIIGIANNIRYIGDFECYTIINKQKIYNRLLIKILA